MVDMPALRSAIPTQWARRFKIRSRGIAAVHHCAFHQALAKSLLRGQNNHSSVQGLQRRSLHREINLEARPRSGTQETKGRMFHSKGRLFHYQATWAPNL